MNAPWALVLGRKGSARAAAGVVEALRARGLRVAGAVQEQVAEGGVPTGYLARRVTNGERVSLARKSGPAAAPGEQEHCSFLFDGTGFATARAWLAADTAGADVVLVDEVSKLEVSGSGHAAAITDALAGRAVVVLAVRADQLFAVMEHFGLPPPHATLEVDGDAVAFAGAVELAVREHAR
jgi:nucleoside-triphosphatase THEP1